MSSRGAVQPTLIQAFRLGKLWRIRYYLRLSAEVLTKAERGDPVVKMRSLYNWVAARSLAMTSVNLAAVPNVFFSYKFNLYSAVALGFIRLVMEFMIAKECTIKRSKILTYSLHFFYTAEYYLMMSLSLLHCK